MLIHDLWRSAVNAMAAAGVPQLVAMSISGHQTGSMFKRYAILGEAEQVDAFAPVESYHKKQLELAQRKLVPMKAAR